MQKFQCKHSSTDWLSLGDVISNAIKHGFDPVLMINGEPHEVRATPAEPEPIGATGEHTPGPWYNQGFYIMARNPSQPLPNAQTIGRTFPDHSTVGGDTLANAVLMAAAPAMLAALLRLVDCPDLNLDDLEPETRAAINEARAAISKAKS